MPKKPAIALLSILTIASPTPAWSAPASASITPAKRVSLDVVGADIRTVLRYLTREAGLSLVLDNSVKGTVTLDLHDMTYQDALEVVLKSKGLGSKQIGNALLVATMPALNNLHLDDSTETLRLNNGIATDIAKNIAPMLPKDVVLFADQRSNSIAIKGPDNALASITKLIKSLDKPVGEVLIEVKMVEMNVTDGDALRFAYGNSAAVDANGKPSPLYVGGSVVNGSFTPDDVGSTINFNPLQPFQLKSFNAKLTWLVTHGKATVLANPKVLAQDSALATINLVNQVPYVTYQVSATGQQLPQVSFVNIGQSLKITPHIDNDGYITMNLAPDITTTGGSPVTIGGSPIPVVNRRSVDTTLRVKDGESVVIGGLLREDKTDNISKIPFLGDLPIIGAFFRQNNRSRTKTEIVVMVTPHIVKPS